MKRAVVTCGAAVISGLAFCLSLAPTDVWWLGWFAFVPLLAAVRGKGFLYGFLGGLVAMLVCAAAVGSGFFNADKDTSGLSSWIVTGCALFGFVVSMAAGIWADSSSRSKPFAWFATLAVCLEAVLLLKLPAHIALTQYRQPGMLYLASIGGIWLVSLLMWLATFWMADLICRRDYRYLAVVPICLLALSLLQRWPPAFGTVKVAAIQTEQVDDKALKALQRKASANGTQLVVWPEFSGIVMAPAGRTAELQTLATEPDVAPFITTFEDSFAPLPHNTSALFTAKGVSDLYYKRRLVGAEVNMHTSGTNPALAHADFGDVGLAICYDSCFSSTMRETATQGQIFAISLLAIDPPAPHHFIAAMHGMFTPFRAAENGVAIIRADGYAYSMIIDSNGRILTEAGAGEAILRASISPPRNTLNRRTGDVFLYLSAAFAVVGIFLPRKVARKQAGPT